MRRLVLLVSIAAMAGSGCSGTDGGHATRCAEQVAAPEPVTVAQAPPLPQHVPGLIFDRQPGAYSADQFAVRSDWPSTLGYYRAPEIIFYRELFRDRQGPGRGFNDWTYRRFDMSRTGQAVR